MKLIIEQIDNRWTVNGKFFNEMTEIERNILVQFLKNIHEKNNKIFMKNLFKSLANFQQEVPVIHKGTSGYGYTYANISQIFEVINPLLKKHGLGFSQPIQGNQIETILFHVESGESIHSLTDIPQNVNLKGMNDFQVLGSAITYLRRYSLSSILGLVTDKDTDASGEQKKDILTESHPNFSKVIDALKKGTHTIEDVKKRYQVSSEIEKILK